MHAGGIRASIAPPMITLGSLIEALPYRAFLNVVEITGYELLQVCSIKFQIEFV